MEFARVPEPSNEPILDYEVGSKEREVLLCELNALKCSDVPLIINGKRIYNKEKEQQRCCADHARVLCTYSQADEQQIRAAIDGSLQAKQEWENMSYGDRVAIFLKAADLLAGKYRNRILTATILGQGKNFYQAEIDAIAELCDFWRFNVFFGEKLQNEQPQVHTPGTWNVMDYRPLEKFLLAISPFNFTAIAGNLASAPALMGNVVLWKPSPYAILSNYLVYECLEEAGLPPGVIQFIPSDPQLVCKVKKCVP